MQINGIHHVISAQAQIIPIYDSFILVLLLLFHIPTLASTISSAAQIYVSLSGHLFYPQCCGFAFRCLRDHWWDFSEVAGSRVGCWDQGCVISRLVILE